ncbi:vacuolar-sorting protein SNF8-like [Hydractinia symbiolongicarpus]|uniref:vacuolar-sorting protein SNF8-like n=1 Tax=Hydractinia symbiolongicarpus TaxID=13093 RepID=UPI0025502DA5|nr:vacuolar-sorting protein SNF8-like [Hydractinia symbiolongicarpus]
MRRGPGLAGVNRNRITKERYAAKGTELADAEISHMVEQLESFKHYLETFASKHQSDIKKNPEFRQHFQKLCAQIGVDPLASSRGFWSEILGVGDFYYELGVQITEVCLATKAKNGGLIALDDLHKLVLRGRGRNRQDVSEDDIVRAIKKLSILGSGFKVLPLQERQLVQSVPSELNMDHTTVLQTAQKTGYTTYSSIISELKWDKERVKHLINYLIQEGMIWVDNQDPKEVLYWVPGFFPDNS